MWQCIFEAFFEDVPSLSCLNICQFRNSTYTNVIKYYIALLEKFDHDLQIEMQFLKL